jgi:hypothetical protein
LENFYYLEHLDSVEFLNKHLGREQVYFYIANLDWYRAVLQEDLNKNLIEY